MVDHIEDDETLHRRIDGELSNGHWGRDVKGVPVVLSKAFLDRKFQPSVDRAKMRAAADTRRSATDGVARLGAASIRKIKSEEVSDVNQKGDIVTRRSVDVTHAPEEADTEKGTPANPAHAVVVTTPQIAKDSGAWSRVRLALAFIANTDGWEIVPPAAR